MQPIGKGVIAAWIVSTVLGIVLFEIPGFIWMGKNIVYLVNAVLNAL